MNHPILGKPEKGKLISFTYNGKTIQAYEGEPIAAALKAAGVMIHRYTNNLHEPRGVFCAIGRCTDCVMIVDGKPNVRTCVTPVEKGMAVQTQYGVSAKAFEASETPEASKAPETFETPVSETSGTAEASVSETFGEAATDTSDTSKPVAMSTAMTAKI